MLSRFARIVPLVRMPRSLGFFDYAIPNGLEIATGDLVLIPFRGKSIPGLVTQTMSDAAVPIPRIKTLIERIAAPSLGEPVVDALIEIAETSMTSPATTAHALLPTVPKRKSLPFEPKHVRHEEATAEHVSSLWHAALNGAGPCFFAYDDERDREAFLGSALDYAHAAEEPLLFIAPRIDVAETFLRSCGDASVLITGAGAMTARWRAWIASSEASIIAGTPLALFTPHRKPRAIIVDEEDAAEYVRSDAAPRFDVRRVAETIAKGWGCPLVFISRTPSVLSWSRFGHGLRLIPAEHCLSLRTVICDFGDEFRSKRYRPITESFLIGLREALESDKRAVVIVNRKGDAARLVCRDCRATTTCNTCGGALAVHGVRLVCPRCRHEERVPDTCPSCHGTRLAGSGAGIDTIAEFLSEMFPDLRIKTFTRESNATSDLNADIILGTEFLMTHALKHLLEDTSIGFVGTLSADTFLVRLSDPMAPEREFQRLRRLGLLAATHGRPLFLQTSEPELPLYAMLAGKPESWYRLELEDRRNAGIHPYSDIARLITSGKDHDKLKTEAEHLARSLKSIEAFSIFEVRIVRSGHQSKAWISLGYPKDTGVAVRASLKEKLPESWGFDPCPYRPIA